jgi:hypothetical protein
MKAKNFGKSQDAPINSTGTMMPHEMPMRDPDNLMHPSEFKRGAVHPDSKGSTGMHGDGPKGSSPCGH